MSEHVWGVDVAVSRLAFAFADLDSENVQVRTLLTRTTETEGARLGLLDRQLRIYGGQLADSFPPACVWVEQPSGRYPSPQLSYVAGVIQAALFETLGCPVWTVPSGKWKKQTLGHGNASKEQVMAWVLGRGFAPDGQDEADAICVAVAGRKMFRARRWDVAA